MNYIGLKCSVCGETMTESDDIVVCPECGAPYHRACYVQAGHCVFEDKHGTPEAWQPPKPEPAVPDPSAAETENICPRCGRKNGASALFCDHCGQPLSQKGTGYAPPYGNGPYPPYQNPQQHPGAGGPQVPFFFDPLGGVKPDEPIGDSTAGEVAKFVQNNTGYYLPVFSGIQKFRHSRFNFCAFLFSGGWLLYRKQYKTGAIFTAIILAFYVAGFAASIAGAPLAMDLMQQAGMDLTTGTGMFTMQQIMEFSNLAMEQDISSILLLLLPGLLNILRFGVMLYLGFRGNRLYYNHCTRRVASIHESAPDPADRALQYQRQGGVNTSLAIFLLVCFMVLSFLPQLFLY